MNKQFRNCKHDYLNNDTHFLNIALIYKCTLKATLAIYLSYKYTIKETLAIYLYPLGCANLDTYEANLDTSYRTVLNFCH